MRINDVATIKKKLCSFLQLQEKRNHLFIYTWLFCNYCICLSKRKHETTILICKKRNRGNEKMKKNQKVRVIVTNRSLFLLYSFLSLSHFLEVLERCKSEQNIFVPFIFIEIISFNLFHKNFIF